MNVKLLAAHRPRHTPAESRMPMHPEYPIAQAFASDDSAVQRQLMQQPWRDAPDPELALLLADANGLRALARSEGALNRVADTLRQRFGAAIVAGPAEVRYVDGTPVLEPYMVVLVNAPAGHVGRVRKDFLARRGSITRIVDRSAFVLEGEAPLADLLGYHEHLRDMLAEDWSQSHVATWLSRYVPVDGGGPEAA
jgi:hypothetical protein